MKIEPPNPEPLPHFVRPGTHLRADRGWYWHHGIALDDGAVIHFTGKPSERVDARVRRTSYADFAQGCHVARVEHANASDAQTICRRAHSLLGRKGYHPLFHNCEHVATWCATGAAQSRQVERTAWQVAAAGWTLRAAAWIAKHRLRHLAALRIAGCAGPLGSTLAVAGVALVAWNLHAGRRSTTTWGR